jgi:hypothetical protein
MSSSENLKKSLKPDDVDLIRPDPRTPEESLDSKGDTWSRLKLSGAEDASVCTH